MQWKVFSVFVEFHSFINERQVSKTLSVKERYAHLKNPSNNRHFPKSDDPISRNLQETILLAQHLRLTSSAIQVVRAGVSLDGPSAPRDLLIFSLTLASHSALRRLRNPVAFIARRTHTLSVDSKYALPGDRSSANSALKRNPMHFITSRAHSASLASVMRSLCTQPLLPSTPSAPFPAAFVDTSPSRLACTREGFSVERRRGKLAVSFDLSFSLAAGSREIFKRALMALE